MRKLIIAQLRHKLIYGFVSLLCTFLSASVYDLVRWGVAADTVNAYFLSEKTKRPYLAGAVFTKNKNEYFPIPYSQILLADGKLVQNAGTW